MSDIPDWLWQNMVASSLTDLLRESAEGLVILTVWLCKNRGNSRGRHINVHATDQVGVTDHHFIEVSVTSHSSTSSTAELTVTKPKKKPDIWDEFLLAYLRMR